MPLGLRASEDVETAKVEEEYVQSGTEPLTKRTRRITFEVIIIAVRIAMAGTKAKKNCGCLFLPLITTSTDSFTLYIH